MIGLLHMILLILILLASTTFAWKWHTHYNTVDQIYKSLPREYREKIDIEAMKDGSDDPDQKFKDFKRHHFPPAYYEAKKWLIKGKDAWDKKDYKYASYCFGVASHYITDSFCAPHYITEESEENHQVYEAQVFDYAPKIEYVEGDLYTLMSMGPYTSDHWKIWLNTKNPSIPRKDLDVGASITYSAIKDAIEGKIQYYPTKAYKEDYVAQNRTTNITSSQPKNYATPLKETGTPIAPLLIGVTLIVAALIGKKYF
ncbi:MAG: zinc dependent phospholipase C family protein [Methanobacteriales archaeon]